MFKDPFACVDEKFPVNVRVTGDFYKLVFCNEQSRCESENFHEIKTGEFFLAKLGGMGLYHLALKTKEDGSSDPAFFDMIEGKQKYLAVDDVELRKLKTRFLFHHLTRPRKMNYNDISMYINNDLEHPKGMRSYNFKPGQFAMDYYNDNLIMIISQGDFDHREHTFWNFSKNILETINEGKVYDPLVADIFVEPGA